MNVRPKKNGDQSSLVKTWQFSRLVGDVSRTATRSFVVWLTGVSAAGKSTLSKELKRKLSETRYSVVIIDGDIMRLGMNSDLGFDRESRAEAVRRMSEMAKLLVDQGQVVIVAAMSPFREEREKARLLIGEQRFVEVHVDILLDVAASRDRKGIYRRAFKGQLQNVSGVDASYEIPMNPDVKINSTSTTPTSAADQVIRCLLTRELISLTDSRPYRPSSTSRKVDPITS